MSGGTERATVFRVKCPHCNSMARIRTSKTVTPLHREIYFQCSNVHCGHSFVAACDIIRTISPSLIPNPSIHLPVGKPANDAKPPDGKVPGVMTG